MNCDEFRKSIDDKLDTRQPLTKEGLPADIRAHAHACLSCTLYLESIAGIAEQLRHERRAEVSPELRGSLLQIAERNAGNSFVASFVPLLVYSLRYILPAIIVWTGAVFFPPIARLAVEITLMIFAMVLMIEKLGRRLLTDRV